MDIRAIIFAFMLVVNTTNAESAQYATRKRANIPQTTQDSTPKNTIRKSTTNAKNSTRTTTKNTNTIRKNTTKNPPNTTRTPPKSKRIIRKIAPKTGLSKTTIITLSTLGGVVAAGGVGVGV